MLILSIVLGGAASFDALSKESWGSEIVSCVARANTWVASAGRLPDGTRIEGSSNSPVQQITVYDGLIWVATLGIDFSQAELKPLPSGEFELSKIVFQYAPSGVFASDAVMKVRAYESGEYFISISREGACNTAGVVYLDIVRRKGANGLSERVGFIAFVPKVAAQAH
ncbi:MAG TPA: hypothetical protein VD865_11835 [Stenotrophomonas sp.]|nr:hypothetical protein [Stenotrophomonas sp.]